MYYSKLYSYFAGILFFVVSCTSTNNEWQKVTYNSHLQHSFFNQHTWSYPWYVIQDDEGGFQSTLSDSITAIDTLPVYHTAQCSTNHQGEHQVDYCSAYKNGDTVFLSFEPQLPAYWLNIKLSIINNKFKASVNGFPFTPEKLEWKVTRQQLTLKTNDFMINDSIKGECYIEFTEQTQSDLTANQFYFSGAFKTVINDVNK